MNTAGSVTKEIAVIKSSKVQLTKMIAKTKLSMKIRPEQIANLSRVYPTSCPMEARIGSRFNLQLRLQL